LGREEKIRKGDKGAMLVETLTSLVEYAKERKLRKREVELKGCRKGT